MERSFRWSVMRRAVLSLWSLFLFLIFGGVFGVHLAHAETCTFVGGAGSSYENTANWDCGHVPALVDDVVISTGETVLMSADRTMNALTVNGTGILNAQATTMSVNGNVTISGSAQVTSTSGTINFYGATVTNNGSIGTVSGNALVNNAITNNGTIHVGSGTFNAYQLTNGIAGTIHGNTGILMIQSAFTNNGTFNVNSGTVWYNLVGPASSSVTTYNNLRVSNANLTLGANTIVNGTLTIDGSGGIRGSTYSFYVLGNVSMDSGTSVSSTSGLINMDGSVTSTGTIGTNTGDLLFEGIVRNDGTIYFGGYATATNSMTNSGTIQNNGQFFIFAGDFTNLSGGVVTSTGAALMFMGNTSSSGSISSGSGALIFEGPLVNHGTVRGDSSATFEFVGAVTSTGSIYASTATTTFSGRYVNSGNYYHNGGSLHFRGLADDYVIASGIYNNVYLQREGDPYYPQASISGTTTVLGYFYMTTGTIFNVGSSDFTVAGQTTLEAGTTVTSTSGTMSFGAVTSTANIGSSSGNMVFGNFMNNGVLRLANTGTATTTGNVTSTGYILLGAGGVLSAMGDLDLRSSVLERGTGTVRFAGSANQDVRPSAHATANFTYFHHLSSIKNGGTVTLTHSGNTTTVLGDLTSTNAAASTLDTGSVHLSVVGGTTIGASGTVTSTNGALRFLGAASSTGSIGTSSGNIFFGDTYQNNGVIDIGSGYATSTGALTNYGTIYGRTGTYTILDSTASISGASLVPGTGTVVYAGTSQLIRSYVYYNLLIRGTAQLSGVSATSTVVNTLTVPSGGSFGVTNSGSDGSVRMTIGSISNAGTFTLAGTAAASVTTTGAVVNTGTLDVGNGILNIGTTLTNSGTFTKGTSIVRYLSNSSISIPGLEYY